MTARLLGQVHRLLAPGWDPYSCRDVSGRYCAPEDEGLAVFDLPGVVDAVGQTPEQRLAIWAALDRECEGTAYAWSLDEGRTHAEVMAMVARATKKARKAA